MRGDERQILSLVCQNGGQGITEAAISSELEDALTNLEHFGLVVSNGGRLRLTAQLFRIWLQRRIGE